MPIKSCNHGFAANEELQPPQYNNLYENMVDVVWIIKLSYKNTYSKYATGFCVHEEGYIVSSAFCLRGADKIEVRCWKHPNFIEARKWRNAREIDGLTLLKVKRNKCDFACIGDDSFLVTGRNVFGISHPGTAYYTFMVGKLASEVQSSHCMDMYLGELATYIKNYFDENIKFMYISGFMGGFENLDDLKGLGGPVFNSTGGIIGMVAASSRGFEYAVTASSLRNFLNAAGVNFMVQREGSGSGSSRVG